MLDVHFFLIEIVWNNTDCLCAG